MKKITLPLLSIILSFSAIAGSGKVTFKPVSKHIGIPKLSGLGKVIVAPIPTTSSAVGLLTYAKSTFDPSAITAVKYDKTQLHPIFFSSKKVVSIGDITTGKLIENIAYDFLEQHKPLLAVTNPKNEFKLKSYEKDNLGFTHIKMAQTYMGKEVLGKELIIHFSTNGSTVAGRWIPSSSIAAPSGNTTAQAAITQATNDSHATALSNEMKKLLKYTGPEVKLVLYPKGDYNDRERWAYNVVLRADVLNLYEYLIDESTGAIIHRYDLTCSTGATVTSLTDLNGTPRTLNTYQHTNGNYYMIDITRPQFNAGQSQMPDNPVGALWTIDAQNATISNLQYVQVTSSNNSAWTSSATSASAQYNVATAYSYYKNTHNRNALDGNGGTIIGLINVTDQNGNGFDNAFWNGQMMVYGNGNTLFKPLAGGLDVAGHEMTHGVISTSANMKYENQSGALNESFADVFGSMIDRSNWTIGEQVCLPGVFPHNALRDLSDPHNGATQGNNGWQPAIMSEFVNTTNDHGGVHINSGITNKAFYLFATATDKFKAEQVYYRALTHYLTTTSQFLDGRIAVVQAATDLYGASSTEVQAARSAFDQVEIYDGTITPPAPPSNVTGTEWILFQNTDPTDVNALYLVKPNNPTSSDFHPLNTTFALNNASVTDDGSKAYFIGTDHNVYSILLNTTTPTQTPITTSANWGNVSVSRDGSKLALVSNVQDTAIYIYSFSLNQTVKYHLYNPTTAQNVSTNGPVFADALDWDMTGENVIYDEKNIINNTGSTTDLSYWDIGLIKVWDKTANTWGTGVVNKLVSSLPDGISIGNPVFSKNHSNIVAFDLSDASTTTFDTKGGNLSTGTIGTILVNNPVPGIPSFNGTDDKITFTAHDTASSGNYWIGIEPLATDMINGNGNVVGLSTLSAYSVWLTQGSRANAQCDGLTANIIAQGSTAYPLSSVVLDAGTGYSSYAWNTTATSQTITVTQAGTYTVTVTKNGCTLHATPLTVGYPLGINDLALNGISVYPIPAIDVLYVNFKDETTFTSLEIVDMTGRLLSSQTILSKNTSIDLSDIAKGMYMLRLKDDAGKTLTTKFVKE